MGYFDKFKSFEPVTEEPTQSKTSSNYFEGFTSFEPVEEDINASRRYMENNSSLGKYKPVLDSTKSFFSKMADSYSQGLDIQTKSNIDRIGDSTKDLVQFTKEDIKQAPKEGVKGLASGTMSALGSVGNIMQWAFETPSINEAEVTEKDNIATRMLDKFNKGVVALGKDVANYWGEQAQKFSTPELIQASWKERPFSKLASGVGQATPMYSVALISTALTKNPLYAGVMFGATEGSDTYVTAREKGKNPQEANILALLNGAWTAGSEALPFDALLGDAGKKAITRMAKGFFNEGLQEVTQNIGSNIIKKFGYDKGINIWEGFVDNLLVGGVMGAGGGAVMNQKNLDKLATEQNQEQPQEQQTQEQTEYEDINPLGAEFANLPLEQQQQVIEQQKQEALQKGDINASARAENLNNMVKMDMEAQQKQEAFEQEKVEKVTQNERIKNEANEMEKLKKTIRAFDTETLEEFIEQRYESGATQEELNFLEDMYAERVAEENKDFLNELEPDDLEDNSDVGLEESLAQSYKTYITGSYKDAGLSLKNILINMRGNIEDFGGNTDNISDEQILEVAKELFEAKQELITKYKNKSIKQEKVEKQEQVVEQKEQSVTKEASLEEEAKKYKTAEEFVESQGTNEIIGYRYGDAPEGEKSYNTRDNKYELGVSLASGFGMEESRGFATINAKEKRKKKYYIGNKSLDKGGDSEFLGNNLKEITKNEYNQLLKTPKFIGQKLKELQNDLKETKEFRDKGYNPYASEWGINRIKKLEKEIIKTTSQLTDIWNKANKQEAKEAQQPKEQEKVEINKPDKDGGGKDTVESKVDEGESEPTKVNEQLLPVGEGEVKKSTLAKKLASFYSELTDEQKQTLPEYNVMSKDDQINKASDYVTSNPKEALDVLKGIKSPPTGLLRASVDIAYQKYAEESGDISLITDIVSLKATRAGQEVSMYTEVYENSPIKYLTQLQKSRIESFEATSKQSVKEAKASEKQKVKQEIKKSKSTEAQWVDFMKSIEC